MMEDTYNSSGCTIQEDPTFYNGDAGGKTRNNKTFDPYFQVQQQQQEEQRNSNRDSGISSEKQKQQQQTQTQPKMNQHLSRFLSDTMKSQNSFNYQKNADINDEENAVKYLLNADGKMLIKQSQKFVILADSWDRTKTLKERQHQQKHRKSPPISSSLPPTSNMQEGARAEINPTRFSDRLTPEIEILHDNEKRENRRPTKYQLDLPRHPQEAQPKYSHRTRAPSATRRNNFELNVQPLSRPRSQCSRESCNSSNRCCHHTTIYQYNCPPDHHHEYENHSDKYRVRKPTFQNEDELILRNLGKLKAACTQSKRIAKSYPKYSNYDDDVFLPSISPPHYTKSSYKKTVEFGSIDSGIEEPSFKKIEIPSHVTSHTIMSLLNFNKKYEFLATMARNLLIERKNVRNLVGEFEAALYRHADLLKRQINRFEGQLSKAFTQNYSKIEKEIEAAKKNFYVCTEKAKDFEAIIQRDKVTFQKLPDGNDGSRIMPDMDYQRRLIYEVFMK